TEFADQARTAKVLATMRRDLDIDADPAELVLAPPDRAQLREAFRQFEFRALLARVDELDEAVPARERISAGTAVPWREGEPPSEGGVAAADGRIAVSTGEEVVVSPRPGRLDGTFVAHDSKALGVEAVDDTMILAYLIDPARSEYLLDDLAAEYAVEAVAEPEGEEGTARLGGPPARPPRPRGPLPPPRPEGRARAPHSGGRKPPNADRPPTHRR